MSNVKPKHVLNLYAVSAEAPRGGLNEALGKAETKTQREIEQLFKGAKRVIPGKGRRKK